MIGYFPFPYSDELVYSWLARYAVKSGYPKYVAAARDLMAKPDCHLKVLFVNKYTQDAIERMLSFCSMDELVMEHTMFPYYGRFLPANIRLKAFQAFTNTPGNWYQMLHITGRGRGDKQTLRYCVLCAKNDRLQHGETYWHRIHQLPGIQVCPIHGCFLKETEIKIDSMIQPNLYAADMIAPELGDDEEIAWGSVKEHDLANYEMQVFHEYLSVSQPNNIRELFSVTLSGTSYATFSGSRIAIRKIYNDLSTFYQDITHNWIDGRGVLQEILYGSRNCFHGICQIGFFFQLPSQQLAAMKADGIKPVELFDHEVQRLYEEGYTFRDIATRCHASVKTVKLACAKKYDITNRNRVMMRNRAKMDQEMLPIISEAVRLIQETPEGRVSIDGVCKRLGISYRKLKKLPLCMRVIEEHRDVKCSQLGDCKI